MNKFKTIIQEYLVSTPLALVIREVSRINALFKIFETNNINYNTKVLDIGCGDGKWWKYMNIIPLKNISGIDIEKNEIKKASKLFDANKIDVTSNTFLEQYNKGQNDIIIGNCSMEHVPDIDLALKNIYQVMKNDGLFIMFVPHPFWAMRGKTIGILHRISPRLSMTFSGMANGFFQHWHLYHHKIWKHLLTNAGFQVDNVLGIGNKRAEFLFRLFLPTAFISFIFKALTGDYLNRYLTFTNLFFLKKQITKLILSTLDDQLRGADDDNIFEYVFICKK